MAGALALLAFGAGCDPPPPPPPPPLLVVNALTDQPDADPGDGTCETSTGGGTCTFRAAVEEANALGRADVVLPTGTYSLGSALEVTGTIHVNWGAPVYATLASGQIHVAADGVLVLEGLRVGVGARVTVDGSLVARRAEFLAVFDLPGLTVQPSGRALVQHSSVSRLSSDGGASLVNHGTLMVDYSDVGGTLFSPVRADLGPLLTTPGADTSVRGSWLASGCVGDVPRSLGYNADAGATCALGGTGDLHDAPPFETSWGAGRPPGLIDAIPVGEIGCGTTFTFDIAGRTRPARSGCDIGAVEQ